MLIIGIKEARQNLPRLLKQVESGEEVIITHRDRPVARLLPMGDQGVQRLQSRRDLRERIAIRGMSLARIVAHGRENVAGSDILPAPVAAAISGGSAVTGAGATIAGRKPEDPA